MLSCPYPVLPPNQFIAKSCYNFLFSSQICLIDTISISFFLISADIPLAGLQHLHNWFPSLTLLPLPIVFHIKFRAIFSKQKCDHVPLASQYSEWFLIAPTSRTKIYEGSSFLLILPKLVIVGLSYTLRCGKWFFILVLISISLMCNDDDLFMWLLSICIFFLENSQIFCQFLLSHLSFIDKS